MKVWRSAGHPGWLGVVLGEFSAYSYVAMLAVYAGSKASAALHDGGGGALGRDLGQSGVKAYVAWGGIVFVCYCFPRYKWLAAFGFLLAGVAFVSFTMLDPRNDHVDKIAFLTILCIELLFLFARWRAPMSGDS
jgi:hypothetical protein